MGWRELIGSLLMKAGDALPAPAAPAFTDPLNYTLATQLQASRRAPAELASEVLARFPGTTPAAYAAICQQLAAAHTLAAELGSAVNKQEVSQQAACQQLRQAFPELAPDNASRLLLQNLIGTR